MLLQILEIPHGNQVPGPTKKKNNIQEKMRILSWIATGTKKKKKKVFPRPLSLLSLLTTPTHQGGGGGGGGGAKNLTKKHLEKRTMVPHAK